MFLIAFLDPLIIALFYCPIYGVHHIKHAATLIDCIWFTEDGDTVVAVIEIENSTDPRLGLNRMTLLKKEFPSIQTHFVIVAPNERRRLIVEQANTKTFRNLQIKYMPYSVVKEVYGIVQRYSIRSVSDHSFIYPFMEQVVAD